MVTVAIDARIVDGQAGGVQQAILGLAMGLSTLDDRGDRYLFLVRREHEWLQPALVGTCRALVVRHESTTDGDELSKALRYLLEGHGRILPNADRALDGAGIDVIHFMKQRGFRTKLPNIYQPHDLQHLEYPERFHPLQRVYRRLSYRAMARQASKVAVMTSGVRADTAHRLGIPEDRVIAIPWASVMPLYGDAAIDGEQLTALGLPGRFLLYPAQTWKHKNHVTLVRAIARLRAGGLEVPLVLTGRPNDHWPVVEREIRRVGVGDLVHQLGFVDTHLLRGLYAAADALVFPSLYEGWGLPVVEAFDVGLPVLCSDISPLREITSDAALRFQPTDPDAMADVIRRAWTDEAVRERLVQAAAARRHAFSWERTAALFRAQYRAVAGLKPLGDDARLLSAPPVV